MKTLKKALTALTLCVFSIFSMACSCIDRSWALKSDAESVSTGEFVLYLLESYQAAQSKLAEQNISSSDLSKETIEDKSATDWIANHALELSKEKIAIEKMFKDMNLELTEEETKKADDTTNSSWDSFGSMYEKNFGVNRDAFHQVYSLLNAKREKIFNALYGKEGSNAVSDEEILKHYKENYVSFKFYSKTPKTLDENQDEASTDEEKSAVETDESIQKQLNEYVEAINNGTKNIDQISDLIKANDKLETEGSPLYEQTININSSSFPQEIVDAIKGLETGKATSIKFNTLYLLLYKSAAGDTLADPDLTDDSKRNNILYEMKTSEFDEKIQATKNSLSFQVNYNAINQYDPIIMGQSLISG